MPKPKSHSLTSSIPYRRAVSIALLMATAALGSVILTPTKRLANINGGINLESIIPLEFGSWKIDRSATSGVVNPQTEKILAATYNQTLSRTYVDSMNRRVMLSIAYGEDQTDSGAEVHHPEVCYPAQGFKLLSQRYDKIQSSAGDIRVKRLATSLGNYRLEPVTYWITIGQTIALTGTEKKLAELKHGLRGEIVDGLLFRVSTIDKDTARAYKIQDEFISTMVKSLPKAIQEKLLGNLRPA